MRIREITELSVDEISLVSDPANPAAVVSIVKSRSRPSVGDLDGPRLRLEKARAVETALQHGAARTEFRRSAVTVDEAQAEADRWAEARRKRIEAELEEKRARLAAGA